MLVSERIQRYVKKLPASFQSEVLDFVEYLTTKVEREALEEEQRWSSFSLSCAMRGLEDEDTPDYTPADLKEVFS